MKKTLSIDGNNLTISDIVAFIAKPEAIVKLSNRAKEQIQKGKHFLDTQADNVRILYGINTGFGPMASYIISHDQRTTLQKNLIRSHACGMGESIDDAYVLATMLIRLNVFAKGFSGVSEELAQKLELFINHRIIPIVPEHGAVGTSGDLVQLAHIALTLMGEGEVRYRGELRATSDVLAELGIAPHSLEPKEGLALINGTSAMTGVAAFVSHHANRLLSMAVRNGALALELVHAFDDSISPYLHDKRPHRGQQVIAATLRAITASSQLLKDRDTLRKEKDVKKAVYEIPEEVQQVYSIRCIPQILGPVFDTLIKAKDEIQTEMNSVTDNPVIDWEHKKFLHGGNFHGDYIATAVDQMKAALVKLSMLSERRINFFLHDAINKHFPPFLNMKTPGLTLGLQGLQFVATSTVAQNQSLAFPHTIHSIPTNADNQDLVSMGFDAAMIAMRVIENSYIVLAIELVVLAQAVDISGIRKKLSAESGMLYDRIRSIFPAVIEDRSLAPELRLVVALLKEQGNLDIHWNS